MALDPRQARATPPHGSPTLTNILRFELADEEQRALIGSYAVASALGFAFLLLVQFGPRPTIVPFDPIPLGPIEIGDLNPFRRPTPVPARTERGARANGRATPGASAATATGSISSAFGAGAGLGVVDANDILGSVAVTRAAGAQGVETGGKSVLAYGEAGFGSAAPSRGGISGAGGGGSIGGVTSGGTVSRSTQQVAALPVVPVAPLPLSGDVGTMGTFVRAHESQMRFCYQERGLMVNPALAGSITVAMTVAANGAVSGATVTKRSWSGPGAAETEACIVRVVRGWRLPASGSTAGTYSFPFNFSR